MMEKIIQPKMVVALLVTFVVLNIADFELTCHGLAIGATEANPIYAANLDKAYVKLLVLPALLISLVSASFAFCRRYGILAGQKALVVVMLALVLLYIAVVVNNIYVISHL